VDVAALTGVTDAQRATLKAIYGETKNQDGLINRRSLSRGQSGGWGAWITGVNP
jgi:hypothetical protein